MIVHYGSLLARVFLPRRYLAITLSSHVLTREPRLDESVLRHEWVHVEQWRRYGLVGFLVRYLWCHFKYGYADNPFEIEARAAESLTGVPDAEHVRRKLGAESGVASDDARERLLVHDLD